jgi:hypothetical protein
VQYFNKAAITFRTSGAKSAGFPAEDAHQIGAVFAEAIVKPHVASSQSVLTFWACNDIIIAIIFAEKFKDS